MSTGIDRNTGRPLSGWPHVSQSIVTILKTSIGERVMRRAFGFAGAGLLGRSNLTPQTMLKFYTAIAIAVALWEPRFRIRKFEYPSDQNSPDKLRAGEIGIRMVGDYMPRALDGDYTVEAVNAVTV